MNADVPGPPWDAEDAFPRPPEGSPYGYMQGRKIKPCTRENLILISGRKYIPLVWTPETPRMVSPQEIPYLFERTQVHARKLLQANLTFSIGLTMMWASQLMLLRGRAWPLFVVLLILTGIIPLIQSVRAMRRKDPPSPEKVLQLKQYARLSAWLSMQKMWATWFLMGCITAVFGWQMAVGLDRSVVAEGLLKPYLAEGEWWRLLTGGLCHGSVLHFMLNGLALLVLARLLEAFASSSRTVVVFLLSVFAGSACSYYLLPNTPSVGASGGILGLQGFIAVLAWRHRRILPRGFLASLIRPIILIGLAGIVAVNYIDNAAHLGGLLAGVFLGLLWVPRTKPTLPMPADITAKTLGLAATVILLAGAGITLVRSVKGYEAPAVLAAKAHECYKRRDYRGAIDYYTAVLKVYPGHAGTYWGRGAARTWSGDVEGALADYARALEINPALDGVYVDRSHFLIERGDLDKALSDAEAALRIDSRSAGAHIVRGQVRERRGDAKGAMEDYTAEMEINPRNGDAYARRAKLRDQAGDVEGSLEDLNAAIAIDPRDLDSYISRAWVHYEKGDLDPALKDCEAALTIAPGDAYALNNRGLARAAKGDIDGALGDYTAAIQADPRNPYAYSNRGDISLDRGNLDAALKDYEEELKIDPESANALWGRGRVRAARKDEAGARADYQKALKHADPGWKGRAEVEKALQQLEQKP